LRSPEWVRKPGVVMAQPAFNAGSVEIAGPFTVISER
jgi:hypothetical protein